jgi:GABA permease
MLFIKSMVSQLLLTLLITAVVIISYFAFAKKHLQSGYNQQASPLAKD